MLQLIGLVKLDGIGTTQYNAQASTPLLFQVVPNAGANATLSVDGNSGSANLVS